MAFPIERIRLGVSLITNTIYIGRVNASGHLWLEKRECIDEALEVVRDYLVGMMDGGESTFGYEWTRKDGKIVELRATIRNGESKGEDE